jgi:hypothetical protein
VDDPDAMTLLGCGAADGPGLLSGTPPSETGCRAAHIAGTREETVPLVLTRSRVWRVLSVRSVGHMATVDVATYLSPYKQVPATVPGWDDRRAATWPASTATLLSCGGSAVLVDALMTLAEGELLADWIGATGLELTTVYVTHAHAGHQDDRALTAVDGTPQHGDRLLQLARPATQDQSRHRTSVACPSSASHQP